MRRRVSVLVLVLVGACAGRSTGESAAVATGAADEARADEVREPAEPDSDPEVAREHRLEDECPPTISPATSVPGEARLTLSPANPAFVPARAELSRIVTCEYRDDALVRVSETFYLTIESQPRTKPGYAHKNPTLSEDHYFVRCQGALRTSLATFQTGQRLSFADNTFTLPCGHVFFTVAAPNDVDEAAALSGRYNYGVKRAELEVLAGPSADDPRGFEVSFQIHVENPLEVLKLSGTVAGTMSTTTRGLAADRWERRHNL